MRPKCSRSGKTSSCRGRNAAPASSRRSTRSRGRSFPAFVWRSRARSGPPWRAFARRSRSSVTRRCIVSRLRPAASSRVSVVVRRTLTRVVSVRTSSGRGYMTPELDRRTFLKLAGATAFVAACGGGAKATGTISIYSALNESTNNQLFEAFTKATGVKVSTLPLAAAGDLQTKITAEKNNPQADIFVGGSSEFHDPLGTQGLLEPYESPNAKDVAAQFKEPSGQ